MSFFLVLLKYNSYTIQFTHLKCTIHWVLVKVSQSCTAVTTINLEHFFFLPSKTAFIGHLHFPSSPQSMETANVHQQTNSYFLCITNDAAMTIVCNFWGGLVSHLSWIAPRRGIAGSCGNCVQLFEKLLDYFPQ